MILYIHYWNIKFVCWKIIKAHICDLQLAKRYHPDRVGGDEAAMKELSAAYAVCPSTPFWLYGDGKSCCSAQTWVCKEQPLPPHFFFQFSPMKNKNTLTFFLLKYLFGKKCFHKTPHFPLLLQPGMVCFLSFHPVLSFLWFSRLAYCFSVTYNRTIYHFLCFAAHFAEHFGGQWPKHVTRRINGARHGQGRCCCGGPVRCTACPRWTIGSRPLNIFFLKNEKKKKKERKIMPENAGLLLPFRCSLCKLPNSERRQCSAGRRDRYASHPLHSGRVVGSFSAKIMVEHMERVPSLGSKDFWERKRIEKWGLVCLCKLFFLLRCFVPSEHTSENLYEHPKSSLFSPLN